MLHRPASLSSRGLVVHVPAFAEEMNRSRRMVALQSRALADAGFTVLRIDLAGCGDSGGDLARTTWQQWIDDIVAAVARGRESCAGPLWLWGLRSGCLLACQAARRLPETANFLFWNPVAEGRRAIQQLFRIKVAGDMLRGQGKGAAEELRRRLAAGDCISIAGYDLAAGLLTDFEAAHLFPPEAQGRLHWVEVGPGSEAGLSPAAQRAVDQWTAAGVVTSARALAGPPFWETAEIEDVPALIETTTAVLCETSFA